ncbi:hypothetical protein A2696_00220 [Candidatus Curtissbacteria bacterium RIFCSPHIGHO2_01_FULL_41_13]|uniref:Uncharacterized protein n=1 Tax=Candidatus Curtissbacteria bacterium RIFCSPHIGHO2_01_FULL_41_13 TaxID=1797745 RepID=A0A1F5FZV1_9BACT|nr:MAG: hypothetical protein A2696_00220 [Candidatus Curtissbacteria bacterium RIFCSPHIGHO2_01_FULL_41_13]
MNEPKSVDLESPKDIEEVDFRNLTAENIQEFMPEWEYQPNKQLKSGGRGVVFSRNIDGKTWELHVDQSRPRISLISSAGDQHIVELGGSLPVSLNRRDKELRFRGDTSFYRIWPDQHRYRKGATPGTSSWDESVVILRSTLSSPEK